MHILLIILLSLLGLLVLGNIFTYPLQHWFIMWPVRHKESFEFTHQEDSTEVWLEGPHNGQLNALHFHAPKAIRKGVVLYFHGNSGSAEKWGNVADDFLRRGWDLFVPDYRGFGKSRGKRTQEILYQDARIAYAYLKKDFPAQDIIIYGRSLGSGIASNLATQVSARRLVLETPFASIPDLFYCYYPIFPPVFLFRYKFRNDKHLEEVSMPVIIFHGTKDRIVPYKSAAKLKKYMKEIDEFVTIFGGGHGDLVEYETFQKHLDEILA